MRHNGSIHKIVFDFSREIVDFPFSEDIDNLLEDNMNQWFLLLNQNGVEEIDISCFEDSGYLVPNWIFSCPTLKRLKLSNVVVELANAYVLPNVTSLNLEYVEFVHENCSDYVVYLPMLEDLSFRNCENIFYFNIVAAPKRCSLVVSFDYWSWHNPKVMLPNFDLGCISSLDLKCPVRYLEMFIEELNTVGQPFALNVEHLKLCISTASCLRDDINPFIQLMRACPKLCELDIRRVKFLKLNPEDFVLMEELSSVAQTQKMLRTLKFSHFIGMRSEMQSIKVLLACFPRIEKVVIARGWISPDKEFEIMQELLRFPCASTKAEIVYI
ncbi:PREDICTED: uncharacterized protein LOC109188675 [Ipomoea nil]|uniref:uncharacterized protein LOC109188675 n=1 Tax=Ipomoea nil TaxID=35883 RepID=UPI00090180FD|nr:PREDICTED: uncharacterized protein LOC109188675 [Ipomoea nil]